MRIGLNTRPPRRVGLRPFPLAGASGWWKATIIQPSGAREAGRAAAPGGAATRLQRPIVGRPVGISTCGVILEGVCERLLLRPLRQGDQDPERGGDVALD